jgi:hypothetical protein
LIKTVISVLVTLAVLNAAAKMGMAAYGYFQLKDEAQQLITFGSRSTVEQLHDRILAHAEELDIPLEADNLHVTREENRTFADAFYTQPVEVFPSVTVPVELSFSVDSFAVTSGQELRDQQ